MARVAAIKVPNVMITSSKRVKDFDVGRSIGRESDHFIFTSVRILYFFYLNFSV